MTTTATQRVLFLAVCVAFIPLSCHSFSAPITGPFKKQKQQQAAPNHNNLQPKSDFHTHFRSIKDTNTKTTLRMSSRGEDPPNTRRRERSQLDSTDFHSTELEETPNKGDYFTPSNNRHSNNRFQSFWNDLSHQLQTLPGGSQFRMPPIQVDDPNLLFYDIFLLLNLVVSISFWVVHRLQLEFVTLAFNEGCLLSILWIISGLFHGAFLNSAVDGHQQQQQQPSTSVRMSVINSNDNDDEDNKTTNISEQNRQHQEQQKQSALGGPPAAGLLAMNTYINTISLRLLLAFAVAVVQHRPVGDDPMEQLIGCEVGFGLILMSAWRSIHSAFTPRV